MGKKDLPITPGLTVPVGSSPKQAGEALANMLEWMEWYYAHGDPLPGGVRPWKNSRARMAEIITLLEELAEAKAKQDDLLRRCGQEIQRLRDVIEEKEQEAQDKFAGLDLGEAIRRIGTNLEKVWVDSHGSVEWTARRISENPEKCRKLLLPTEEFNPWPEEVEEEEEEF